MSQTCCLRHKIYEGEKAGGEQGAGYELSLRTPRFEVAK
jgi:hypothetical protein